MDTDILWAAVDTRRRYLVDLFETLTPQQWDTASLCAGWTVRDVAGHLTMLDMSTLDIVRLALRHPGSTNRLIHKGSQEIASRHSNEELVAKIRALIGSRRTFPGLGGMEALLDLHAHTLDVTLPLGIDPELPPDQLAPCADHVIGYAGGRNSKVFAHLPIDGVTLRATDTDWTHGTGPEASGRMQDLYLVVTGRRAGFDGVTGPGVAALRD